MLAACPGRGCDAGILLKNLICSGGPDLSDCDPQTAAAIENIINQNNRIIIQLTFDNLA